MRAVFNNATKKLKNEAEGGAAAASDDAAQSSDTVGKETSTAKNSVFFRKGRGRGGGKVGVSRRTGSKPEHSTGSKPEHTSSGEFYETGLNRLRHERLKLLKVQLEKTDSSSLKVNFMRNFSTLSFQLHIPLYHLDQSSN